MEEPMEDTKHTTFLDEIAAVLRQPADEVEPDWTTADREAADSHFRKTVAKDLAGRLQADPWAVCNPYAWTNLQRSLQSAGWLVPMTGPEGLEPRVVRGFDLCWRIELLAVVPGGHAVIAMLVTWDGEAPSVGCRKFYTATFDPGKPLDQSMDEIEALILAKLKAKKADADEMIAYQLAHDCPIVPFS